MSVTQGGTLVATPRQAPQGRPEDARTIESSDPADDRGRRWYQPRPKPRRRSDFMGLNSTWWMALGWLVLIIAVAFPFPWWW